jgi:ATP-dependent Clp protease adaptor protein ClpS
MATTVSRPRKAPANRDGDPGSGRGRPWLVIVRNDNHNTFDGVAFALARTIPGVTFERGMALADTIHRTGKAVVWTGEKERAELYWEQLAGFGLTMAPLTPAG